MDFNSSKQVFNLIESQNNMEFSSETMLAFIAEFSKDIEKNTGKNVDELPIRNEKEFLENMVKLGMMIGRIYNHNSAVFADDSSKRRWGRAENRLSGLNSQLDSIQGELKALESIFREAENKEKELAGQLARKGNLEQQIAEKNKLITVLESKFEESKTVERDIRQLQMVDIPEAEKELAETIRQMNRLADQKQSTDQDLAKMQKTCDELTDTCFRQQIKKRELTAKQEELSNEIEGLKKDNADLSGSIENSNNTILALESEKRKLTEEAFSESESCRRIQAEKEATEKKTQDIITARVHLQKELADKETQLEAEKADNNSIQAVIDQRNTDIKNYISVRNALLVDIKNLETQIEEYEKEYRANADKKQNLLDEIQNLQLQAVDAEKEIRKLESDKAVEEEKTAAILSDRTILSQNLKKLQDSNAVMQAKNEKTAKTVVDEQSTLNDLTRKLNDQKDLLENKRREIIDARRSIETTLADTSDCGKKITELNRELSLKKEKLKENLDEIRNLRSEAERIRLRTKGYIRNHQIENSIYADHQKWMSDRIKTLLGDGILTDNWMYARNNSLELRLSERRNQLDRQIKEEMKLLNDFLTELEGR